MKFNKFFTLIFAASTLFLSCSVDDDGPATPDVPQGEYSNGIFVLNEGNFGSGNSTVSFIDGNLNNITHNIFRSENTGDGLGDTAQSMAINGDYAWIVVNVSNKIEIVDRNTFKRVATIDEGLENPRYIAFSGGNAFVTNWGDGGDPNDDYVAVFNANNFSPIEEIPVAEGPEQILFEGRNLYVAHEGGWSFNNKLSVINAASFVVEEFTVGDVPNSMAVANGYLWIASSGFPSYAETETAGKIQKLDINTLEVVTEFTFDEPTAHPANLHLENGIVYYTLGNSVYQFPANASNLPSQPFLVLTEVENLYGFEVEDGFIYAASASSSNTGDGELFIYQATTGDLVKSFETGINPNGIYFN